MYCILNILLFLFFIIAITGLVIWNLIKQIVDFIVLWIKMIVQSCKSTFNSVIFEKSNIYVNKVTDDIKMVMSNDSKFNR